MTYKNRKPQLWQTLKSIELSNYKDYEVIIFDDLSDEEHRIEDAEKYFKNIKIIRPDKESRNWINPVIPYNITFKEAKGDIVIIQNSECAHVGDILSFVSSGIKENQYLNFSCLSYTQALTEKLTKDDTFGTGNLKEIMAIAASVSYAATNIGQLAWYNHPKYLARGLHFCSAITKKDLDKIKGFDERFAQGYNFDDNEFAWRISESGMEFYLIENPFVIHQFHYNDSFIGLDPEAEIKVQRNSDILNKIQSGEIPIWSNL